MDIRKTFEPNKTGTAVVVTGFFVLISVTSHSLPSPLYYRSKFLSRYESQSRFHYSINNNITGSFTQQTITDYADYMNWCVMSIRYRVLTTYRSRKMQENINKGEMRWFCTAQRSCCRNRANCLERERPVAAEVVLKTFIAVATHVIQSSP